jgi:NAD(P)-dependent dehydrogenase (short-subunit alcohol dehydrogenase family)
MTERRINGNRSERLAGKVALVTGSSSGNGRAIALRYAHEGAAVLCADLRPEPVAGSFDGEVPTHERIAAEAGEAAFSRCDVRDGAQVEAVVAEVVTRFGRVDVAVVNAGISLPPVDLPEEPWSDYERTLQVNQHGAWWTAREASRQMILQGDGGRIIVLASVAGLVGTPSGVAYCMSKGAVVQLTRALAAQVAKHTITVNAICPGYIRTAMTRDLLADSQMLESVRAKTPLPRLGEVDDVAGCAFFLASDDAAYVTGVAIPVDGGYTAV